MKLPNKIIVLDLEYKVKYCDNPVNVDTDGRQSLWGQIDYWTRTIRVYTKNRCEQDILHTIFHELVHAIHTQMKLTEERADSEKYVDLMATGLNSLWNNNDFLRRIKK